MLAHHDGLKRWILSGNLLHGQPQFETGPHPGDIRHRAIEYFLR